MPVFTIASNAGVEGSVVVGNLLEQDNTDLGYDAAKGMFPYIIGGSFDPFTFKWVNLVMFHLKWMTKQS